jgi:hypothetical protein
MGSGERKEINSSDSIREISVAVPMSYAMIAYASFSAARRASP